MEKFCNVKRVKINWSTFRWIARRSFRRSLRRRTASVVFTLSVICTLSREPKNLSSSFIAGQEFTAEAHATHRSPGARLSTERIKIRFCARTSLARLHRSREQYICIAIAKRCRIDLNSFECKTQTAFCEEHRAAGELCGIQTTCRQSQPSSARWRSKSSSSYWFKDERERLQKGWHNR